MKSAAVAAIHTECRRSAEARYIHRLHGVLLVIGGLTTVQAGKLLQIPQRTVASWVKRYEQKGLEGLLDAPKAGRRAALDAAQYRTLYRALSKSPRDAGLSGDVWTGELVSHFLRRRFKVNLTIRHSRRLLRLFERERT